MISHSHPISSTINRRLKPSPSLTLTNNQAGGLVHDAYSLESLSCLVYVLVLLAPAGVAQTEKVDGHGGIARQLWPASIAWPRAWRH